MGDLHVSVTIYSRIGDDSQFQQATGATPQKGVLLRMPDVAVTSGAGGRVASTCVTVLPNTSAPAPTSAPGSSGACAAGDSTVYLDCTPGIEVCGNVYPVSVALLRKGSSSPVERFSTFLTYQEPGPNGSGRPLRVAVIAPVHGTTAGTMAAALSTHHDVPITLDVEPGTVTSLLAHGGNADHQTRERLADLSGDQLLSQPYVPINLPQLAGSGLSGEIAIQLARGAQLLRQGGLHPVDGPWVDTTSKLTTGNADELSGGLQTAHANRLVLSASDLAPGGLENYTFAQPFTLNLGHNGHLVATAVNSDLSAFFTAETADPTLAANQLLAGLSFVHFENASLTEARGVVVEPPVGWHARSAFMNTLLTGLTNNPALIPVTLSQFFTQVPVGGNQEPSSRKLQSGAAGTGSITKNSADKILLARQHLTSYTGAITGHPAELTVLSDSILATEAAGLSDSQRAAAVAAYDKAFSTVLGNISLANERTVTFTSRTAPIPISVLSSAPYPVTVVMSLASDKFSFPNGSTRTLQLTRATTSVRVQAQARTSGDRLPIEVTLRTPDGQLTIAHAELTVHSTSISIVGVGLTVLAGLVLLVWWVRTWRRARRRRPRAH
jgi:hypothetical protein